ncbi:superfamily II DNA or RNA helicase [Micromonospora vinacea]|uniref:Superfamily II DNA or RNA helicase n=1 Tax=Micromonospora vinacea TaxID=709878 RepID=A0ABS0JWL5_9ACTN|nr:DEAD/DEAH box helicase family protein [Micromonospora vinacea]MBG6100758.1 superfamily II DNA or RNA helicase [Micromonospora vinacea]
MDYDLYDYQEQAKQVVVRALMSMTRAYEADPTDTGAVVLAAPTGAGKTVIATAVIEAALDGDPTTPGIDDSTFLWVTDDPSLNNQTLNKMFAASSALSINRLRTIENDFDQETLDPGRVYFLNIQKLSANATLSKGGGAYGRQWSLWDTISNTVKQRPYGFVVVVDEAHRGMGTARTTRDTIVSQIIGGGTTNRPAVPVVWGISATPKRFRDQMNDRDRTVKSHTIPIEDVRSSGLLKDQIVLGHTRGVDAAETTLVRHAVAKVLDYEARWNAYCNRTGEPRVNPVLVVQVEDKPNSKSLGEVVDTILSEWPGITPVNIVHVFGNHSTVKAGGHDIRWCPPEDVQDRQSVRVVLCMTAITTGWDCPRAEVLVSMRVAQDQGLITQIMGRMVRTPLARRVESDVTLNAVHCILPKFNEAAVDAIAVQFEQGDEGIAGGTEIITDEVQLIRNPEFTGAGPVSKPPNDLDGPVDASDDLDTSWFGPDKPTQGAPTTSPSHVPYRPDRRSSQTGPDLWEGSEPDPEPDAVDASASANVFALLESLPSYTIPSRCPGSAISRAFRLAALLAQKYDGKALEPAARKLVLNAFLGEIDTFRADLDAKGELADRVAKVANTRLYERSVTYGSPTMFPEGETESDLALDDRGIRILMARARRALPEGLVDAYVERMAPNDDDVTDAMILAIALAQDAALPEKVEARAANLVTSWLQQYHSAITRLPETAREDFDRVRRQSSRPEATTFRIPPRASGDARGGLWDKHVLSDADGKYRADLRPLERHVLLTELDHGAVAWYRNPANRAKNALVIPWQKWDGWHGLYVDFLFVHYVGGQARPSIIDPHGAFMADAVGKLKGLADYIGKHPGVYHRVQVVDLINGKYRLLDLLDPAVRSAVADSNADDAGELYAELGHDY